MLLLHIDAISWVFANSDMGRVKELQFKPDDLRRWVVVAFELSYRAPNYKPVSYVAGALLPILRAIPLPSTNERCIFNCHIEPFGLRTTKNIMAVC